jgi:tRNA threonylcarbamoyladenosine biosynthesis protein TsaE
VDTIISNSAEHTMEAGRRFAQSLARGDVVCLTGELGAGKTHFAKGVVAGLGGDAEEVTSPTFTIMHEYREGRIPVFHFDLYRLESDRELQHIGWDDYLQGDAVCLVEWADKFPEALPSGAIWLDFSIDSDQTRRVEVRR